MEKCKFTRVDFQCSSIENYISIVIPVYKDAKGLSDTLCSIRNATVSYEDYEIIVANDGGDERIKEVSQKFGAKCVDIVPRSGSYVARNKALEISRGQYIAFTDADVTVCKEWLEYIKNGLSDGDYLVGKTVIDSKNINSLADDYEFATAFQINKRCIVGPTVNIAVKRSVIEKIGGFDSRLQSGGDYEFGNRVVKHNPKLKRNYIQKMLVIHPPRGHKEMIKKYHRIMKGKYDILKNNPRCAVFSEKMTGKRLATNALDWAKAINIAKKMTHVNRPFVVKCIYAWYMETYRDLVEYRYSLKND